MDKSIEYKKDLLKMRIEQRKQDIFELQKNRLTHIEHNGSDKKYMIFQNIDETLDEFTDVSETNKEEHDLAVETITSNMKHKKIYFNLLEKRTQKIIKSQRQKLHEIQLNKMRKLEELKKQEYKKQLEEKKRKDEERRRNKKDLYLKEKTQESRKKRSNRASLLSQIQKTFQTYDSDEESCHTKITDEKLDSNKNANNDSVNIGQNNYDENNEDNSCMSSSNDINISKEEQRKLEHKNKVEEDRRLDKIKRKNNKDMYLKEKTELSKNKRNNREQLLLQLQKNMQDNNIINPDQNNSDEEHIQNIIIEKDNKL